MTEIRALLLQMIALGGKFTRTRTVPREGCRNITSAGPFPSFSAKVFVIALKLVLATLQIQESPFHLSPLLEGQQVV
jgi:hypothetical protein